MAEKYTTSGSAKKPFLKPNVLHQYASFNTIFTLSGITEQEIRTSKFLTNPVHDIVARSGGIGEARVQTRQFKENNQEAEAFRTLIKDFEKKKYIEQYQDSIDILDRGHDLFIENVNMISTVGPNAERNLGNFTKMEFEIHEPYSITFIEKIRAATSINGFLDYQDAPMLLTIEFKGFDEQGRPYTQHKTNKSHVRKIPILISRVDFDVNEGGARYQVMAVPYTDLAFDDRFKYPRTNMPIEGDTPEQWAFEAEKALRQQMEDEYKEQRRYYPDVYKFVIDKELRKLGLQYKNEAGTTNSAGSVQQLEDDNTQFFADNVETLAPPPKQNTMSAQASQGIALTKFFEDAVRNGFHFQELANDFWTTYIYANTDYTKESLTSKKVASIIKSKEFEKILFNNQYIDWFKIKTTVYTDTSRIDPITKMHPKTITYKAVPYKIHILKFVGPGVSIANVDWGKKVHKEYDYIYTGDNVDVQSLRINYKTAYYLRNVRGDDKSATEKGLFAPLTEAFKNVFGRERDPEPLLPLRQYPSAVKGANSVQTLSGEGNKAQQFYDYLTNPEVDMMRIELEILGDPTYICQDMYVPIHQDGKNYAKKDDSFDTASASFLADSFQPIISVRYRLPDDVDEREGTMFNGLDGTKRFRDENLFFNGLYQVNKIESKFDNGQFLQTLHCSRFNNQQGAGAPPLLANAASVGANEIKNTVDIQKAKDKAEEIKNNKPKTKFEEYLESVAQDNIDWPV